MRTLSGLMLLLIGCLPVPAVMAGDNFSVTPMGARYQELQAGTGLPVAAGDLVTMHFICWLDDHGRKGRTIFNSRKDGRPVSFVVGTDRVMPGWNEGVTGMRAGGRRLVLLPPSLAYGGRAIDGIIPPNAGLIFIIEVMAVEKRP